MQIRPKYVKQLKYGSWLLLRVTAMASKPLKETRTSAVSGYCWKKILNWK